MGLAERQAACEAAVREAGAVARRYFEGGVEVLEKTGPQDLLSVADQECEALLVARLSAAFPGDGFQGEEGAAGLGDGASAGVWVIDPIDGTNNFVRGDPMWCVSVSYNVGDCTELGVIYDVMADHLFSARRGAGATLNGARKLAVSTRHDGDLGRAMVCVGTSTQAPRACFAGLMRSLADTGCGLRFGGSTALALCYVAAGRWDAYYEYGTNTWDALAGHLLVTEAGGRVTPFPVRDADGRIETRRHKTYAAAPDLYDALDAHIEASRALA